MRAKTGNTVEDKDEKVRLEARLVLKALFAKLDALSHFHFAPKPIVKDMAVQSEVPALAMEEVAPQVCIPVLYLSLQWNLSPDIMAALPRQGRSWYCSRGFRQEVLPSSPDKSRSLDLLAKTHGPTWSRVLYSLFAQRFSLRPAKQYKAI